MTGWHQLKKGFVMILMPVSIALMAIGLGAHAIACRLAMVNDLMPRPDHVITNPNLITRMAFFGGDVKGVIEYWASWKSIDQ